MGGKAAAAARGAWEKAFLEERPSAALGLFRIFAAFTTAAHVIPTLLHAPETYLSGSFRTLNPSFFTPGVLEWAGRCPDPVVWAVMSVFVVSVSFFLIGLFSQAACVVTTACCYFLYARNSLHVGTLSFDILLVTLVLLCVTPYPGDALSLDAARRGDVRGRSAARPVFILRLLQIQIASIFFFTGLSKITGDGNWLTGNPFWHLMTSSPESVVKAFPGRELLAASPGTCYAVGVGVVACELAAPFLLAWKRTRTGAAALGVLFHVLLVITLHVPTIFLFLFPAQLALFLDLDRLITGRRTPAVSGA